MAYQQLLLNEDQIPITKGVSLYDVVGTPYLADVVVQADLHEPGVGTFVAERLDELEKKITGLVKALSFTTEQCDGPKEVTGRFGEVAVYLTICSSKPAQTAVASSLDEFATDRKTATSFLVHIDDIDPNVNGEFQA